MFYNKDSSDTLQCPALSKRTDSGIGYSTFVKNLFGFNELGCAPLNFKLPIDDSLEQKLKENAAKWHKGCKDNFNKTKLQRAEKRKKRQDDPSTFDSANQDFYSPIKRRRTSLLQDTNCTSKCFFCEDSSGKLHQVLSLKVHHRVEKCASILNDNQLTSKLSAGDLVAQDALYHSQCLSSLYKNASNATATNKEQSNDEILRGLALAEVVSHIETKKVDTVDGNPPVFKLADLVKIYAKNLEDLGLEAGKIHSTDFKNRLLSQMPDLQSHREGKNVFLAFDKDVALVLQQASNLTDSDDEAMILAKAAKIIRRDILKTKLSEFDGTFNETCKQSCLPHSLMRTVSMILSGCINSFFSLMLLQRIINLKQKTCTTKRIKSPLFLYT